MMLSGALRDRRPRDMVHALFVRRSFYCGLIDDVLLHWDLIMQFTNLGGIDDMRSPYCCTLHDECLLELCGSGYFSI